MLLKDMPDNTPFRFLCDDKGNTSVNTIEVYERHDNRIYAEMGEDAGYPVFLYEDWQVEVFKTNTEREIDEIRENK